MKNNNHVNVNGRLSKDAELKNVNGLAKLEFTLIFNTTKKVGEKWEEESNFLNLAIFGNRATSLAERMKKGVFVSVDGHLKQSRWEKDGQKQSKLDVYVDDLEVISTGSSTTKAAATNDSFPEDEFPF